MNKYTLEVLFRIFGIGSASGLIYLHDSLFIVSDNAGWLYEYHLSSKTLEKIPVVQGENLENIPKHIKPDFEAITSDGKMLYLFGSGSTDARQIMYTVNISSKTVTGKHDLSWLYNRMRSESNISTDDLNIEGAVMTSGKLYLFQRGNGAKGENGIFEITGNITSGSANVSYHNIVLPKINKIPSSFTDAVAVGNQIYFLASAEDSASTYEDGDVAGSLIGKLDILTMQVIETVTISSSHKFEGLTLLEEDHNRIVFLICEDNDSDLLESEIFRLEIQKG